MSFWSDVQYKKYVFSYAEYLKFNHKAVGYINDICVTVDHIDNVLPTPIIAIVHRIHR